MDKDMSDRELKEAFVSNLNGTSLGEVSLGCFLAPLCLLSRGLFLLIYHHCQGILPLSSKMHLLLDFSIIILPLVLSCTILSDILHLVIVSMAVVNITLLIYVHHIKKRRICLPIQSEIKNFLSMNLEMDRVPFVTAFRVLVNVKTAISILAVDFSVFPRRYAKTETYGTGVMDFGVGAYILANSLVCPEVRKKEGRVSTFSDVFKQLLSVWPLIFLGMARLISLKVSGYHEHMSEYGVHWNFFFTLAIVRMVASVLLAIFSIKKSWILGFIIAVAYQMTLEATELKSFIQDSDRTRGFLSANKEGLFSVIGYIAIYMIGVQIGFYVMKNRTLVKDWIRAICNLLLGSVVLWVFLYPCQVFLEPVSRRMANLSFCIWTVAQSLLFLSLLSIADLILTFAKMLSNCSLVSCSWDPVKHSNPESVVLHKEVKRKLEGLCLIQAVNRNQLLFFMLANIMTGLTNVLVDTVNSHDLIAVCILISYMFITSFITYVLHRKEITLKFW
ncbi:phosphatidylinositol-glycan biosynthesis class W protein [Brienomyrus brachyistius]|uniref:phosphatidylinositol-glycan biosynthesis class W protein n=1 Tax=Brienomyrus brachyistius TaxID=42636 RepID=UPI0020B45393|nr:phosphatidylinositol-glycan biosynthesis class W protein [Brienomyrus brachyistius]XP_048873557.1 phosphatidylinositol-glycan biosynthesis class W protein [Brienomyrus brachyistius]